MPKSIRRCCKLGKRSNYTEACTSYLISPFLFNQSPRTVDDNQLNTNRYGQRTMSHNRLHVVGFNDGLKRRHSAVL
jgi:hypothetical protein